MKRLLLLTAPAGAAVFAVPGVVGDVDSPAASWAFVFSLPDRRHRARAGCGVRGPGAVNKPTTSSQPRPVEDNE